MTTKKTTNATPQNPTAWEKEGEAKPVKKTTTRARKNVNKKPAESPYQLIAAPQRTGGGRARTYAVKSFTWPKKDPKVVELIVKLSVLEAAKCGEHVHFSYDAKAKEFIVIDAATPVPGAMRVKFGVHKNAKKEDSGYRVLRLRLPADVIAKFQHGKTYEEKDVTNKPGNAFSIKVK